MLKPPASAGHSSRDPSCAVALACGCQQPPPMPPRDQAASEVHSFICQRPVCPLLLCACLPPPSTHNITPTLLAMRHSCLMWTVIFPGQASSLGIASPSCQRTDCCINNGIEGGRTWRVSTISICCSAASGCKQRALIKYRHMLL
jgi:hypothetical protein